MLYISSVPRLAKTYPSINNSQSIKSLLPKNPFSDKNSHKKIVMAFSLLILSIKFYISRQLTYARYAKYVKGFVHTVASEKILFNVKITICERLTWVYAGKQMPTHRPVCRASNPHYFRQRSSS